MKIEKAFVKEEKDNKYRYLHDFLERIRHFAPLVFSADGIPGKKAWATTQKMASHLRFKLNCEYYEMFVFVR